MIELSDSFFEDEMVFITMGYPFAYQTLGKYMWESGMSEFIREYGDI